jgi:hypothetical protein
MQEIAFKDGFNEIAFPVKPVATGYRKIKAIVFPVFASFIAEPFFIWIGLSTVKLGAYLFISDL